MKSLFPAHDAGFNPAGLSPEARRQLHLPREAESFGIEWQRDFIVTCKENPEFLKVLMKLMREVSS